MSKRNQTAVPSTVKKILKNQQIVIATTSKESLAKKSRGMGKHLWKNVDIDEYINQLRDEW